MVNLAELRAKLLEKENQERTSTSDNAIFPFWNMDFNAIAVLRFLPDGNESNDFFWVERQMIRLPFSGIKGQNTNKEVYVQVPCAEMFGDTCPILTQVRPWFKETDREALARKYWKKRSYIFQGFVRDNPLTEDDGPENPIRRFVINTSIFQIIKSALMDPEMEDLPTDSVAGVDFRLTKTKQGEYADYKTSSYSRKSSALTSDEAEAIEKYSLFNLSDFLPKKPGDDELQAIKEMFEASVDGEVYDPDRWVNYYKPAGLQTDGQVSTHSSVTASAEVEEKQESAETKNKSPQDIIADIRRRAESKD